TPGLCVLQRIRTKLIARRSIVRRNGPRSITTCFSVTMYRTLESQIFGACNTAAPNSDDHAANSTDSVGRILSATAIAIVKQVDTAASAKHTNATTRSALGVSRTLGRPLQTIGSPSRASRFMAATSLSFDQLSDS